jgi:hypothetical protein
VAAILLGDVLGAYPFLLLPDEWFYFLIKICWECRVQLAFREKLAFRFFEQQVLVRTNFHPAECWGEGE